MKIVVLFFTISFSVANFIYSAAASTKIKTVYVSQTTGTNLSNSARTEHKTDPTIAQLEQTSLKIEHNILYNILYSKFFLDNKQIGAWRWHIIEEQDVFCCCIKVGLIRRYGIVTVKWAASGYEDDLDKKIKALFIKEYNLNNILKSPTCAVIPPNSH